MTLLTPPAEPHALLYDVSWRTFQALLDDLGEHRGRITYDRGVLEIMTPSHAHENINSLIGRLIEAFTEELGIKIKSAGSTTLLREDLQRGVEPDTCYYVDNEHAVRGKDDIDLSSDPPPDLAIEIEISRTALSRFPVYAALGIQEVWRYRKNEVTVYRLQGDGQYLESAGSTLFPLLPMADFTRFVDQRKTLDETELVRSFRAWVRDRLMP